MIPRKSIYKVFEDKVNGGGHIWNLIMKMSNKTRV